MSERIKRYQEKANKQVMEGQRDFKLTYSECAEYLGVLNHTFHSPCCIVKHINEKTGKAYIEAIFFGSGMVSHPVKHGFVPLSAIQANLSWLELFFLRMLDKLKPA